MMRGADGGDGWSFDGETPKRSFGVEATAGREQGGQEDVGPALRRDPARQLRRHRARARHGARRRRRERRLPGQRDLHLHRARPRARARVHALVQRLDARRVPGRRARSHRRRCRCCRSTTASTSASPRSSGCIAKGARGRVHPRASRCGPTTTPTTTRCARAWPKPACPLTFHRTFGGKPSEADWDELVEQKITTAGTVYRFFAAVRPFTYMVDGRRVRPSPDASSSSAPRSTAAGCRSGRRRWSRTLDIRAGDGDAERRQLVLSPTEYLGAQPVRHGARRPRRLRADRATTRGSPTPAMFSTDYPHSVTLWPTRSSTLPSSPPTSPDDMAAKVLSGQRGARVRGLSASLAEPARVRALDRRSHASYAEPDVKAAPRRARRDGARPRSRSRRPRTATGRSTSLRSRWCSRRSGRARAQERCRRSASSTSRTATSGRAIRGDGRAPRRPGHRGRRASSSRSRLRARVARADRRRRAAASRSGVVVALGLGGTLTEVLDQVAVRMFPLHEHDARRARRHLSRCGRARRIPRRPAARPRRHSCDSCWRRRARRARRRHRRRALRARVQPGSRHPRRERSHSTPDSCCGTLPPATGAAATHRLQRACSAPRAIAVAGASTTRQHVRQPLARRRTGTRAGPRTCSPSHPEADPVDGVPAIRDVGDADEPIDYLLVGVPAPSVAPT